MKLDEWVTSRCKAPGFSDMHIDRFSERWLKKDSWVAGGLAVLNAALRLRDDVHCSRKLAVAYSLAATAGGPGCVEETADLLVLVDHSPPSLFIAEAGAEPWITSEADPRVRVFTLSSNITQLLFPSSTRCVGLLTDYRATEVSDLAKTVWFVPEVS